MDQFEKIEKYKTLVGFIEHYPYKTMDVLMFPLSDGKFILEACKTQIKLLQEKLKT